MAKRAKPTKPRVCERTLWAIQQVNGRLLQDATADSRIGPGLSRALLCRTKSGALFYTKAWGCGAKPVKVRERIEVL